MAAAIQSACHISHPVMEVPALYHSASATMLKTLTQAGCPTRQVISIVRASAETRPSQNTVVW